ncbi:MAG TPA: phosphoesterase, partial [Runella sp.]|nr:phosphoesterase [Runella sp.]
MKNSLFFVSIKKRFPTALAALVALTIYSCRDASQEPVEPTANSKGTETYSADVATKWAEMDLVLTQNSTGFTPPVAARALGYAGVAMYEAVVPGIKDNRSLVKQLNGLADLPVPEANQEYNWAASANAAQIYMAKNLWPTANEAAKKKIDSLGTVIRNELIASSSQAIVERSESFGYAIGKAIFDWSKTDGGHEGFTRNFPATYKVPVFPGSWQPTENGRTIPMLPYWGQNRTFIAANGLLTPPAPLTISTQVNSPYFQQYYDVYK